MLPVVQCIRRSPLNYCTWLQITINSVTALYLLIHNLEIFAIISRSARFEIVYLLQAFLLETLITISFLRSFDFIDDLEFSHGGANKLISSFLGRNILKSAVIIFSMFLCKY